MEITIYCPDRHILYDGMTPDQVGVGGGITARLRLAAALARCGHRVCLVGNCPRHELYKGVEYIPLTACKAIRCDTLVMHSSGGDLDLTPLLALKVDATVRVLALSGVDLPKGTPELRVDSFYACSNFLRIPILASPLLRVAPEMLFVSYYGVNRWNYKRFWDPSRDSRRLMYSSHPSKGLDAARSVAHQLREKDGRFSLHIFGGDRLWGGSDRPLAPEPGVFYGGLMNQRQLAQEYKRSGFLIQLQTRPEPFGIVLVEALAAGCLVVASPVGALSEIVKHGENGFLVEGDPADPGTKARAAEAILGVCSDGARLRAMRRKASREPLGWDKLAEAWVQHFIWLAQGRPAGSALAAQSRCPVCGGEDLALADGVHCTACGLFRRSRVYT